MYINNREALTRYNTFFTLCGCAGSGKTTLSKLISSKYNARRLSFDEMHCLQYTDLIPHIKKALKSNKSVVVDGVCGARNQRCELLQAIKDIPCKKILFYVDKPLETCLAQNAQREHPLSDGMIRGIYHTFEPPTLNEGWDEIITIH